MKLHFKWYILLWIWRSLGKSPLSWVGVPSTAGSFHKERTWWSLPLGDRRGDGGVDFTWLVGDHDATSAGDGLPDHQVLERLRHIQNSFTIITGYWIENGLTTGTKKLKRILWSNHGSHGIKFISWWGQSRRYRFFIQVAARLHYRLL